MSQHSHSRNNAVGPLRTIQKSYNEKWSYDDNSEHKYNGPTMDDMAT